ncbi:hypothetical protein [Micromonospora sp. NPDC048898]|uniref:hypothetical protein n=1 Tax=Micromonospora sp. NPDC048898 TaxID=3364260 RepID=UPI003715EFFA
MLAEGDDRCTLMLSAFAGAPLRTDEAGLRDVARRLPGEASAVWSAPARRWDRRR